MIPALARNAARALLVGAALEGCSVLVAAELADRVGPGGGAGGEGGAGGSQGQGGGAGRGGTASSGGGGSHGGGGHGGAGGTAQGGGGHGGADAGPGGAGGTGSCTGTTANCDGTGCDVDLGTDINNCGACKVQCANWHGKVLCQGGACTPECAPGFAVCDGDPKLGCAADLQSGATTCGACGNACNAGRACVGGACQPSWAPMGAPAFAFAPRQQAAFAWMGDALFVWGGQDGSSDLGDGAVYDPSKDAWTALANQGAPSPRDLAAAVWTGSHVVVWGGGPGVGVGGKALATGARWARATSSWVPIADAGAPAPRRAPIAAWTGSAVLIWGGTDEGNGVAGGALYDDAADAWKPISDVGAPAVHEGAAWALGGATLYLFGGDSNGTATSDGYAYDTIKDAWRVLPSSGAPSPRTSAFAAWVGDELAIFGGLDGGHQPLDSGALYAPATDTWTTLTAGSPPPKRAAPFRRTGWVGSTLAGTLIAGGWDGGSNLMIDGKILGPDLSAWKVAVPAFPSHSEHEWGVGLWTGQELLLWSGLDNGVPSAAGERYKP